MRHHFLFAAAALTSSTILNAEVPAGQAQKPAIPSGNWQISEQSSPLTGARSVSAVTQSSNEIANSIGYADRASLVIRCGEGGLAIYVNWTEVVNRDGENFAGSPKTIANWRIDDGKIETNFWDISTTGTAAGEFRHKNALKLISSLVGARKLAVRLSGRMMQDAGFDLTGVDGVIAKVTSACGVRLK